MPVGAFAWCFNISQRKIIIDALRVVLQYLTGQEYHNRCVKSVLAWCFNISQGKKIIIDTLRVYLHGASISHRVRRSL